MFAVPLPAPVAIGQLGELVLARANVQALFAKGVHEVAPYQSSAIGL